MATPTQPAPRAIIYTRLSEDRDGTSTATRRQLIDSRITRDRIGATNAAELSDPESSGWSKRAKRPGWDEALRLIREGKADTLICWRIDRLGRASRIWGPLFELVDDHGLRIVDCNGIDTNEHSGRVMLGILAEMARSESASISMRVKRASDERAANGRPHGGRYRGFGHNRDGSENPAEADVVRECVRRLLDGETSYALRAELQARGVTTETGRAWDGKTFKAMLMSARIAGGRERDGAIVQTGALAQLVPIEDVYRVRTMMAAPWRNAHRRHRATTLLGGLMTCGGCGEPLYYSTGKPTKDGRDGGSYDCHKRHGRPGACGSVSVKARIADRWIAEQVIAASRNVHAAAGASVETLLADLHTLDAEEAALGEAIGSGELPILTARAASEGLRTRRRHVEHQLARAQGAATERDVARLWPNANTAWRRGVISDLLARIVVEKARRGERVDISGDLSHRLRLVWQDGRGQPGTDAGHEAGVLDLRGQALRDAV